MSHRESFVTESGVESESESGVDDALAALDAFRAELDAREAGVPWMERGDDDEEEEKVTLRFFFSCVSFRFILPPVR